MEFGDLQRRLPDEVAQFGRLDDLGVGTEGEHVGRCRGEGAERQPRLYPAAPSARRPLALPAHPQARRPPAQGGEPPAVRGQANPRPLAGPAWPVLAELRADGRKIDTGSRQQLEPAAAAAEGVDREARCAQRFDVAKDGALRNLQFSRQLRGGHPASGLQQAQKLHQPAGTHGLKSNRES